MGNVLDQNFEAAADEGNTSGSTSLRKHLDPNTPISQLESFLRHTFSCPEPTLSMIRGLIRRFVLDESAAHAFASNQYRVDSLTASLEDETPSEQTRFALRQVMSNRTMYSSISSLPVDSSLEVATGHAEVVTIPVLRQSAPEQDTLTSLAVCNTADPSKVPSQKGLQAIRPPRLVNSVYYGPHSSFCKIRYDSHMADMSESESSALRMFRSSLRRQQAKLLQHRTDRAYIVELQDLEQPSVAHGTVRQQDSLPPIPVIPPDLNMILDSEHIQVDPYLEALKFELSQAQAIDTHLDFVSQSLWSIGEQHKTRLQLGLEQPTWTESHQFAQIESTLTDLLRYNAGTGQSVTLAEAQKLLLPMKAQAAYKGVLDPNNAKAVADSSTYSTTPVIQPSQPQAQADSQTRTSTLSRQQSLAHIRPSIYPQQITPSHSSTLISNQPAASPMLISTPTRMPHPSVTPDPLRA